MPRKKYQELVDKARHGDVDAQRILLDAYCQGDQEAKNVVAFFLLDIIRGSIGSFIGYYVRKDCNAREYTNDLVQDVLLGCEENNHALLVAWNPERGALPAYLGGVARNIVRYELTKLARRARTVQLTPNGNLDEDAESMPVAAAHNPERSLAVYDELTKVQSRLIQDEGERNVGIFETVKIDRHPIKDIAQATNLDIKEVENIVARVKRKALALRDSLSEPVPPKPIKRSKP